MNTFKYVVVEGILDAAFSFAVIGITSIVCVVIPIKLVEKYDTIPETNFKIPIYSVTPVTHYKSQPKPQGLLGSLKW